MSEPRPELLARLRSEAGEHEAALRAAVAAARQGAALSNAAAFADGTALGYERYFFIGHGDVASIYDQYLEARGLPYGEISGHVLEANTALNSPRHQYSWSSGSSATTGPRTAATSSRPTASTSRSPRVSTARSGCPREGR